MTTDGMSGGKEVDWQDIGTKMWFRDQFNRLFNEHVLILKKLNELEQQYWVLFRKMGSIEEKLDHAPWIQAASLKVTFDEPVAK